MKQLIFSIFLITSLTACSSNKKKEPVILPLDGASLSMDTSTDKENVAIPLTYRADTVKLPRVVYRDHNGYLKSDSGYAIKSGKGNVAFDGFFRKDIQVRVFVDNKEIKKEDVF